MPRLVDLPYDALIHIGTFLTSYQLAQLSQTQRNVHSILSVQCAFRLTDHYALLTRELVLRKIIGMNLAWWKKNPAIRTRLGSPAMAMMAVTIGSDIEKEEFSTLKTSVPYPPIAKRYNRKPATDALAWAGEYMQHFSTRRIQSAIKKCVTNKSELRVRLKKALTAVGMAWIDTASP